MSWQYLPEEKSLDRMIDHAKEMEQKKTNLRLNKILGYNCPEVNFTKAFNPYQLFGYFKRIALN